MPPKLNSTPAYSSNIELYGDSESAGLTPRTPYSRLAANAEEGRSRRLDPAIPVNGDVAEEDDGNLDEIDLLQTQSHPLLHSSASGSFPLGADQARWSRSGKQNRIWRVINERLLQSRLPIGLIAGSGVAFLLLFLIVMSIRRPDALQDYIGVNSTAIEYESLDEESKARFNGSTVIDYFAAGYTSYPLTTDQYISECWKVMNDPRMKFYAPYWSTRPGAELDVLHKVFTLLTHIVYSFMEPHIETKPFTKHMLFQYYLPPGWHCWSHGRSGSFGTSRYVRARGTGVDAYTIA